MELEGYTDIEKIASSGNAVVYSAAHVSTGAAVAIKAFNNTEAHAESLFRRGYESLLRLSRDPNVVEVIDFCHSADGTPCLVLELLGGSSLNEIIRAAPEGIPEADAVWITAKILSGLEAAHGLGLLHRGLKPANVLFGNGDVKLADFGVAKLMEEQASVSAMLTTTVIHAAPETLMGEEATPSSDVFSVGAMLYSMLSGRNVHPTVPKALAWAAKGRPAVELNQIPGSIRTKAWLARALAHDPRARFVSASEALAELGDLSQLQPSEVLVRRLTMTTARLSTQGLRHETELHNQTREMRAVMFDPADTNTGDYHAAQEPEPRPDYEQSSGEVDLDFPPPNMPGRPSIDATISADYPRPTQGGFAASSSFSSHDIDTNTDPAVDIDSQSTPDMRAGGGLDGRQDETEVWATGEGRSHTQGSSQRTEAYDAVGHGWLDPREADGNAYGGMADGRHPTNGPQPVPISNPHVSSFVDEDFDGTSDRARTVLVFAIGLALLGGIGFAIWRIGAAVSGETAATAEDLAAESEIDAFPVPSVVNSSEEDAKARLRDLGLTVTVKFESSDAVRKGFVIAQSVPPENMLSSGDVVTLTVSSGPSEIPTPTLVGLDEQQVMESLASAGLRWRFESEAVPYGSADDGKVVGQTPGPNVEIAPGSEVSVVLGQAPLACEARSESITAPDLQYLPPHTRGDKDYAGNGPRTNLDIQVSASSNQIAARLYMKAEETRRDFTTAEGSIDAVLYTVPDGWKIQSAEVQNRFQHQYVDRNNKPDVFNFDQGLVRQLTYEGNGPGPDIGVRTGVVAAFHPFTVNLVELGECVELDPDGNPVGQQPVDQGEQGQ